MRLLSKRWSQKKVSFNYSLFCYHRQWELLILIAIVICIFVFSLFFPRLSYKPALLSVNDLQLPQSLRCPFKNNIRLELGRLHLAQSRIIICALMRDNEKDIPRIREQLKIFTSNFADYVLVIVENDSKDRTRYELLRWAQEKEVGGRIHTIGCGYRVNDERPCNLSLTPTPPGHLPDVSRIEKMVHLRNIYMEYIEANFDLGKFEYVMVQDFDLMTYTYTDGLLSTGFHLSMNSTIDAICANGIQSHMILGNKKYFDAYAHKDEKNMNWSVWHNDLWSTLFRYYPCNSQLEPVQSCFSGRTIYRYRSIMGKRYRTYLDSHKQAICEHVGFHEKLNNVYLNSEMIFFIIKNDIGWPIRILRIRMRVSV